MLCPQTTLYDTLNHEQSIPTTSASQWHNHQDNQREGRWSTRGSASIRAVIQTASTPARCTDNWSPLTMPGVQLCACSLIQWKGLADCQTTPFSRPATGSLAHSLGPVQPEAASNYPHLKTPFFFWRKDSYMKISTNCIKITVNLQYFVRKKPLHLYQI